MGDVGCGMGDVGQGFQKGKTGELTPDTKNRLRHFTRAGNHELSKRSVLKHRG